LIADRPAPAEVERAQRPLKIAFVYCRNPLPMRRADQITVAHLLEFLCARGHEVDLFCFDGDAQGKYDNAFTAADIAWLQAKCRKVITIHRSRTRAVLGALAALTTGKPLQVGWLTSTRLAKALSVEIATNQYDVLYAYYFRSAETVIKALDRSAPLSYRLPTVLAMQLSQTINTRRIRDNATNIATKLVFGLESRLVSRYEAHIWQRFDRTALIGPVDVDAITAQCRAQGIEPIDNWFYSPHGTDVNRFRPRPEICPRPDTVLFAGTLFYPPNIQAATWLAKSIWPLVRTRAPQARLRIVGRDPAPEVLSLQSDAGGIEVVGSVPDLGRYMLEAAVCVNPVRAAGGMQNKLIEYLSSGRPVVATAVANEGIGAPTDVLSLADTAEEFANAIVDLLSRSSDAEDMGRRAREFALNEWSWEAHWLRLEDNLRMLAEDGSAS
jgi:glycosyltransferase involved in cell wall biosynthesis